MNTPKNRGLDGCPWLDGLYSQPVRYDRESAARRVQRSFDAIARFAKRGRYKPVTTPFAEVLDAFLTAAGVCSFCGVTADLVLDHDHYSGHFRGWVCDECNKLHIDYPGYVKLINAARKAYLAGQYEKSKYLMLERTRLKQEVEEAGSTIRTEWGKKSLKGKVDYWMGRGRTLEEALKIIGASLDDWRKSRQAEQQAQREWEALLK